MDGDGEKRKSARKGHAVLLTMPDDLMERLRAEAAERTVPVATAARLLIVERLEHLRRERKDG